MSFFAPKIGCWSSGAVSTWRYGDAYVRVREMRVAVDIVVGDNSLAGLVFGWRDLVRCVTYSYVLGDAVSRLTALTVLLCTSLSVLYYCIVCTSYEPFCRKR